MSEERAKAVVGATLKVKQPPAPTFEAPSGTGEMRDSIKALSDQVQALGDQLKAAQPPPIPAITIVQTDGNGTQKAKRIELTKTDNGYTATVTPE
jgi:hypothetical protein